MLSTLDFTGVLNHYPFPIEVTLYVFWGPNKVVLILILSLRIKIGVENYV